jgi:hypothetical protein
MMGVCSNMEPSSVLIAIYITALLYSSIVAGGTPYQNDRLTRAMFQLHSVLKMI